MGGMSPKTCWASYKYEIKFRHTVASCWIFYVNYGSQRSDVTTKKLKIGIRNNILERSGKEPTSLNNVIAGDEQWIFKYDYETERQSLSGQELVYPIGKASMSGSKVNNINCAFQALTSLCTMNILQQWHKLSASHSTEDVWSAYEKNCLVKEQ